MAVTAEELQVKITAKFNELNAGLGGAKTAVNNFNTDIRDSFNSVENSTRRADGVMSGVLSNWIVQLGLLTAAFKAVDFFGSQIEAGIQFNSTLENSRLGIASLITAQASLKDATGQTLTGTEALAAATGLADDQMQKLRVAGLQTAATTKELAIAYQAAIGSGLSAGLNLDQIRTLTIQITQAAGAMAVPMDMLKQEVTSILRGDIDINSVVAKNLGLTNAQVRAWKEQGVLAAELGKRLESFTVAGAEIAKGWDATKTNMGEARDAIAGMVTSGYLDELKRGLQDAMGGLFNTKTATVSGELTGATSLLSEAFTDAGRALADLIRDGVQGFKDLSQWIDKNRGNLEALRMNFHNTAAAIAEIWVAATKVNPLFEAWHATGLTIKDVFATISLTIADIADRVHYITEAFSRGGFMSGMGTLMGGGAPMAHTRYEDTMRALTTPTGRDAYAGQFASAEKRYGLPPGLLSSMAGAESSYNPLAVSSKGATGLMQLMPGTAAQYGVTDLKDAGQSIEGAARYMADLLRMFHGDLEKAVQAYNAGQGNIQKGIVPAETKAYTAKVLGGMGVAPSASGVSITPNPAGPDNKELKSAREAADEAFAASLDRMKAETAAFQRAMAERKAALDAMFKAGQIDATAFYTNLDTMMGAETRAEIEGHEKAMDAYRKKLATEKAGTKEYIAAQRDIAREEQAIAALRSKGAVDALGNNSRLLDAQRQFAAQMRQITQAGALEQVDYQQELYRSIAAMGGASIREQIAMERRFEQEKYRIQREGLQAELRLLREGTAEHARQKQQLERLEHQHELKLRRSQVQELESAKEEWRGYFSIIGNAFSTSIQGMILGTQTWQQAMGNILQSILGSFVQFLVEMGVKWAAEKVAELVIGTTTNTALATSGTALAAINAASSVAAIPFVGWAMAPGVAAQTAAMLAPFVAMASASQGFDIPAGVNPITQLHQREMVLPAKHAEVIRRMADGGQQGGGAARGGDTYHVNINAMDSRSFHDALSRNGASVVKVIKQQARNGVKA